MTRTCRCLTEMVTIDYSPYTVERNVHVELILADELGILLDFSLTVKVATLIFMSGCGSAISSAKEGKPGSIYNLVKS